MDSIPNIRIYNDRMRASMYDKLWFVDKLPTPASCVYDYGCADGSLLQAFSLFDSQKEFVGYDISPEMIELAKNSGGPGKFTTVPIKTAPENTLVVCSSVFHEIHNYSENIERDYNNIFGIGAKYIAIRDMGFSSDLGKFTNPDDLLKVLARAKKEQVTSFQNIFDSLKFRKNFVHFLLKYRYVENWEREVRENYFPYEPMDLLLEAVQGYGYSIVYREAYTLPFIKYQVKKDFGIDLQDKTHYKVLLERKG